MLSNFQMTGPATLALLLSTLVAVPTTAQQIASGDDARQHLEERQSAFYEAMTGRDAGALSKLFAENATIHVAGMPPITGVEAIKVFFTRMFGFLEAASGAAESVVVSEGGDMAYTIGRTSNSFRGPEGPVEYDGKFVIVWSRNSGEWMIDVYSVSSNQQ